jgi:hypothetical protein
LVLRIVLGGRDGLVGRAARCAGAAADASIAGDTVREIGGSGFWGKIWWISKEAAAGA